MSKVAKIGNGSGFPPDSVSLMRHCLPRGPAGICELLKRIESIEWAPSINARSLASWIEPPTSFRETNPVERVTRIVSATSSLLPLHWLSSRLGGVLLRGKPCFAALRETRGASVWFVASLQFHKLVSSVVDAFVEDHGDGRSGVIDESEGKRIARRWAHTQSWIGGFLASSEYHPGTPASGLIGHRPTSASGFRTTASWEILDSVCNATKTHGHARVAGSRKEIALRIDPPDGTCLNSLNKWLSQRKCAANPDASGMANPLDYVLALSLALETTALAEWLAWRAGCLHVPSPGVNAQLPDNDPLKAWEITVIELMELDAAIARALLDDQIDRNEYMELAAKWKDVMRFMNRFCAAW